MNYVRDSIARTLLAEAAGDGGGSGNGIDNYAYLAKKQIQMATNLHIKNI